MECNTIIAWRSVDDVSDFYLYAVIFPAVWTRAGVRLYEQMAASALSDPGSGMGHPGYAAYAPAYHHLLRTGIVAWTQYLER